MSRVDELIAELCPDGVDFLPLAAVGKWYGGGTPSKARPEFWQGGSIPWISPKDMGRFVVDSTEDYITQEAVRASATKLVPPTSIVMVVRSSILDRVFPTALVPVRAALNQDMKAVVPRAGILPEYIAHLLRSHGDAILRAARKSGGSVASIESSRLFSYRIPVPPVAVQREIIGILDSFTQLEAELEAELEARQLQYVHYRDSQLRFGASVQCRPLGNLGTIFGGLSGKSKADFLEGNARFVSYVNVLNNIAVDVTAENFVRVEPGERQHALQRGDVLFTGSSETPEEVAMSSVVTAELDEPLYLNSFTIGYRLSDPTVFDPEFTKHLFRSRQIRTQLVRTASGVTRFNVSKVRLARVEVPIPSLAEQRHIAGVLDSFEALVNDVRVGLPAELAARRRQYEFYRDRLLSFEELVS